MVSVIIVLCVWMCERAGVDLVLVVQPSRPPGSTTLARAVR